MIIKSCGSCGRQVPAGTEVGEKCPYCGARFDFLRQSRSSQSWVINPKVILAIIAMVIVLAMVLPYLASKRHPAPPAAGSSLPAR